MEPINRFYLIALIETLGCPPQGDVVHDPIELMKIESI